MSYEIIESSVHDGDIVELYEFTLGQTTWRYTSNALDYEYIGNLFSSVPIDRSQVERAGEMNRNTLRVTISSDNPIANLFIIQQPRNTISIRIYQGHRNDEMILVFSGRVLSCKWNTKRKAELQCDPIITSFRRQSLKINYGLNCPYVVYSSRCRATRVPVAAEITAVSGTAITLSGIGSVTSGRLVGGVIVSDVSSRTITSHSGSDITISSQFDNASVGNLGSVYIGCNKSTVACKDWHNNIDNFGGEPYIPQNNPFKGRIND